MFPCLRVFIRGHLYWCICAGNITHSPPRVRLDAQTCLWVSDSTFLLGFGVLLRSALLLLIITEWTGDSNTTKQVRPRADCRGVKQYTQEQGQSLQRDPSPLTYLVRYSTAYLLTHTYLPICDIIYRLSQIHNTLGSQHQ